MLTLTRQETALVEFGRILDNWKILNEEAPEETECEGVYLVIDSKYQQQEDAIEEAIGNSEEVFGINSDNNSYELLVKPDRKPPTQRPTW